MYFLDFLDFQVAGASPEPLLTVSGRHASTRPIAGTRPRGATLADDERIAGELLADEKERAEHVMLVDLGRNDLGRVCEYGTRRGRHVHVGRDLLARHAHRLQRQRRRCATEVGAMDALRSILPAGTLSGAPKVRAMEIIDELEPVKRGGYGGAIGWLSYTGDLDTCIHIRTVVVKDGRAHVQAGGGTVADAQARLRVRGVREQGQGRAPGARAGRRAAGVAVNVLVVDNYDSFTYNLVQYLGELGAELEVVRNDAADGRRAARPARPTASSSRPARARRPRRASRSRRCGASRRPGSRRSASASGTSRWPQAFGGTVIQHEPVHGKTTTITHDGRTLYAGLAPELTVGRYHSLVVDEGTLPDCFEQTAHGGGVLMGIRHRELPAEGVQFHPESVLTESGRELLANFLDRPMSIRGRGP